MHRAVMRGADTPRCSLAWRTFTAAAPTTENVAQVTVALFAVGARMTPGPGAVPAGCRAGYDASSRMTLIRSDLPSKPMPGSSGMIDVPVLDTHAVREAAVGLEQVRVALVAAEPEAGRDVERHLVPAVRDAARRRPAELVAARPGCAGIRPARRRARSRTAASRGPAACRRSAAGCARPGARTGSRRSPSGRGRTRPARPAARSPAGRPTSSYQNRG